ncbi:Glucuronoxylan 4-O-methyltransferase 3 [Hibiscus syriacus]|uniref:Glucuronoxylan 4-O-methyltransferase 3 n=1 Tax=Hibiscus syriacus TaxID=106335 RepID=A0A6A2WN50_HIBSY|nr:probable methyltransferase At1g27930 [Hibiscus syriacus]KAE8661498.1 Glucuronoxylan 4-O-methyltransferase 3 [Hibiscus syriacus]
MNREDIAKHRQFLADRRCVFPLVVSGLIAGAILTSSFIKAADYSLLCSVANTRSSEAVAGVSVSNTGSSSQAVAEASVANRGSSSQAVAENSVTPIQLQAIIHYATSRIVPQQSFKEISVTFDVLKKRSPCNFLVFGLGYDSLMWTSLNPKGHTIFLEEDPKWVQSVLKDAPSLHAHPVKYLTQLKEADALLSHYRSEKNCFPSKAYLHGNNKCKLALTGFPDEFYDTEWDLIMIDAPRGYFPAAPGRMAAIFSAAVMARNRKGTGVTHVFLHDVDRKVEKTFAEEFLCRKYLVKAVGRLWHFEIPSASNMSSYGGARFC